MKQLAKRVIANGALLLPVIYFRTTRKIKLDLRAKIFFNEFTVKVEVELH